MATLEKIRNRAGVLVAAIIGLSLLAFILGDFLESGRFFISGARNEVAQISGKSVGVQEYQQKIEEITNIYKSNSNNNSPDETALENIREQAWQQLIQDYIMNKEIDRLGIFVSSEELYDMIQGTNPHPIIRQMFTNPQTGELNRTVLYQFLKAMNEGQISEDQRAYWLYMENEIKKERTLTKYGTLISKGLNVTGFQGNEELKNMGRKVNFSYIVRRFNEISDSSVLASPAALKKYYKEHKNEYNQVASRGLEYVAFEVKPSEADDEAARKWINGIQAEFVAATDMPGFVSLNSDVPFDSKNYKESELSDTLRSAMFKGKIGDSFGPYFENGAYRIARLAAINLVPDSVKARHILIRFDSQDEAGKTKAMAKADSLKKLLEAGKDFAELAKEHSADQGTAAKGGDLGWFAEGAMVKPFNDACFNGKKGEITVVESQYGAHLIQILDKGKDIRKVQVASVVRNVEASDKTYQHIYNQSVQFAFNNSTVEKFDKAVATAGITVKYAQNLKPNDSRITGLESPRELIRWAYTAKVGDITNKPFECGDRFVIAKLSQASEEGIAPLEDVKAELELNVKKELKAEKLIAEITAKNAGSLADLGTAFNRQVQEASNVSFSSNTVGGIGNEPVLVAVATSSELNKLSAPVKGLNGVYVLMVTSVDETGANADMLPFMKSRIIAQYQNRAAYDAKQALQDMARIKDRREKFF